MATKYYCDACGNEKRSSELTVVRIILSAHDLNNRDDDQPDTVMDLCNLCKGSLQLTIKHKSWISAKR